jgi:hypothetical protein
VSAEKVIAVALTMLTIIHAYFYCGAGVVVGIPLHAAFDGAGSTLIT